MSIRYINRKYNWEIIFTFYLKSFNQTNCVCKNKNDVVLFEQCKYISDTITIYVPLYKYYSTVFNR